MAASLPASDEFGSREFGSQGFEALARMVLDIPAEAFDVRAAAFDAVVAALHDIVGRLRVQIGKLQEDLRGVAGEAAGESGELLRSEVAAVAAAISGDGAALYRAGDAVAGAQRAMQDLAAERARTLAATPTPQVAAQFDELARRIATGLAQTYRQVGTSLAPIPGTPAAAGGGAGGQGPDSSFPDGEFTAARVDGPQPPPELFSPAETTPVGLTPEGSALHVTPVPISAFAAAAGLRPPAGEGVGNGGVALRHGGWTAGIANAAPPAAVLGRVTAPAGTRQTGAGPGGTGDVLPPGVLRSAGAFGTGPGTSATPGPFGRNVDTTRTEPQQDGPGRNPEESVSGMPPAPVALAAVNGRGRQPGEQQLPKDTSSRRTAGGEREVPDDGAPEASATAEPVESSATASESTARVPERVTPPPPTVEASALADMPAPASRRVAEHGGAFERGRSDAPVVPSFTPVATSLHSTGLHAPEPVTGSAGAPGQGPPPMLPPMGGMGPMGGTGGMGGLAGRVEPERTREVSLQEDPGAWDDDIGGAPAVLGRR
jgi:hypothetical protein